MRLVWATACVLMAIDCVEKAMDTTPQHLFAPDLIWLWWPAAIGYAIAAFCALAPQPSPKRTTETFTRRPQVSDD